MRKFRNAGKICLMALVLLGSGCGGLPEFPYWVPFIAINSENKKIRCVLVDRERMVFECDQASTPLNGTLDGFFCTDPAQQVQIIRWAQQVKRIYQKNCGK